MSVWRPWDADDEEYAERSLIRDAFPEPLRAPVLSWINATLRPNSGYVAIDVVHNMQTALQVNFGFTDDWVDAGQFVALIANQGDEFLGRVVDLLLSEFEPDFQGRTPVEVERLKSHLDWAASALDITERDRTYRLKRRVVEGVEELAEESRRTAHGQAGQHLGRAWGEAFALNPNTSLVMTEAIKAVEAAAHPVVTPKDRQVRLGKITQAMKGQTGWTLAFPNRDDGHPDHKAVIVGMLETLIIAQADRHGGQPPSVLEAQGHVQLASTLVQWFSTGVVVRESAEQDGRTT